MLQGPFLTEIDSRARIKGSRDPLGAQTVWTALGRRVVGNLTTVSSSVRDFTVLLVGSALLERRGPDADFAGDVDAFLRWEQLASYIRHRKLQQRFRGVERVSRNLLESSRVALSAGREHQILGNQRMYGIWGLYIGPARASGLLHLDAVRLAEEAGGPEAVKAFVEKTYSDVLNPKSRAAQQFLDHLMRKQLLRFDIDRDSSGIVDALGKYLRPSVTTREREFYRFHLLHGGRENELKGLQPILAELIEGLPGDDEFRWSPAVVGGLARAAEKRGHQGTELAKRLQDILACESVLAPATALFSYLLTLEGRQLGEIATRLQEQWGGSNPSVRAGEFTHIAKTVSALPKELTTSWFALADCLRAGQYAELVQLLVRHNALVMGERGGAAWVELDRGRLRVKLKEEAGNLPERKELPGLWRFPYFLESLRQVAIGLREVKK
jgi:hypothetical protein